MDFEFSPEQELFRKTVREFCQKTLTPVSREMERKARMPDSVIDGLSKMGLFGLAIPPNFGGSGADALSVGIAGEEIGRADLSCSTAVLFLVPVSWSHILSKFGSDDLKKKTLPNIASGKSFLGIATTEPGVGSDLANMSTNFSHKEDGYVLNGEKMYISGIREAKEQMPNGGGYLVLARNKDAEGHKMSFFYVPINAEGITTTYVEEMGRRGMSCGGFLMKDVRIPAENLLGEENKGFYYAMEGFDYARAIIAAVCTGAAMAALEAGMEYIKQRRAFTQPIGRFEGVQFKLAEDYARVDAARLLAYRGLWLFEKSQHDSNMSRFVVSKAIAEAKMIAPVFAFEAINDALQWFGAYGYTLDCPLEMGLRGVRSYMLAEGSTEVMKIIVARELLGKDFIAYR
ncbi:MAG: acyl-CoA dehydrogenase family protein [Candidatus Bathyarchaeia archaeon]|jgi:acyl-CoA dehydrogenase